MINNQSLITISGDSITVNEFKQSHTIKVSDFVKKYSKRTIVKFESPELPQGTIKYMRKDSIDIYYVHVPMGYYNFSEDRARHKVLMPHTIFRISMKGRVMQGQKITWSFEPVINLKSRKFVYIPMQNIYTDRRVCIGNFSGGATQKQTVENFVRAFFENDFNGDISKGVNSNISAIATDQAIMIKDGHDEATVLQRWFKRYSTKTKKLTTMSSHDSRPGRSSLIGKFGTLKTQFGD